MTTGKKLAFIIPSILIVCLAGWFFIKFYFVFGKGYKTGELNQFVQKGYIFKTYEGKLIQTGLKSKDTGLQSNEFSFSVEDEAVADSLMHCTGKTVELGYKEYLGALPWRGMQKFIVVKIHSVKD